MTGVIKPIQKRASKIAIKKTALWGLYILSYYLQLLVIYFSSYASSQMYRAKQLRLH